MMDRVFKLGILIIGILFLILFYHFIQNNRFQMKESTIIDTSTGIIYDFDRKENLWRKLDPKSGDANEIPLKRKAKE